MNDDERNQLKREIEARIAALKTTGEEAPEQTGDIRSRLEQVLILLKDPDYGVCTVCHKDISIDRLVAVPESRVCEDCAQA